MRYKKSKKSFDWYSLSQRYSIRKFHFGAASVLLGTILSVGTATTVSAEEPLVEASVGHSEVSSEESTAVLSPVSDANEATASAAVASPSERTAVLSYTVRYVDETGKVVYAVTKTTEVTTERSLAMTFVTEVADTDGLSAKGYELVDKTKGVRPQTVTEGADNVVEFAVKKVSEQPTQPETDKVDQPESAQPKTEASQSEASATTVEREIEIEEPFTAGRTTTQPVNDYLKGLSVEELGKLSVSDFENLQVTAEVIASLDAAQQRALTLSRAFQEYSRKRKEEIASGTSGFRYVQNGTESEKLFGYNLYDPVPYAGVPKDPTDNSLTFATFALTENQTIKYILSIDKTTNQYFITKYDSNNPGELERKYIPNPGLGNTGDIVRIGSVSVYFRDNRAGTAQQLRIVGNAAEDPERAGKKTFTFLYHTSLRSTENYTAAGTPIPRMVSQDVYFVEHKEGAPEDEDKTTWKQLRPKYTRTGVTYSTYTTEIVPIPGYEVYSTPYNNTGSLNEARTRARVGDVDIQTSNGYTATSVVISEDGTKVFTAVGPDGQRVGVYTNGRFTGEYSKAVGPQESVGFKTANGGNPQDFVNNYRVPSNPVVYTYKAKPQVATIRYAEVDDNGEEVVQIGGEDRVIGMAGTEIGYSTTDRINSLSNAYSLVLNGDGFTNRADRNFDDKVDEVLVEEEVYENGEKVKKYSLKEVPTQSYVVKLKRKNIGEIQTATITYVDVTNPADKKTLGEVDETHGRPGETSDYRTTDRINEYKLKGYKVVFNDYPETGVAFDNLRDENKDKATQKFTVELVEVMTEVTPNLDDPNNPVPNPNDPTNPLIPGDPIDPKQPGGPFWPTDGGLTRDDLVKEATRTIHYVYEKDGSTAAQDVTQKITYVRTATVNNATGKITYSPWRAVPTDTAPSVKSPVIAGYTIVDNVETVPSAVTTINEAGVISGLSDVTVKYREITEDTQFATITYKDITDKENPKTLGDVATVSGLVGETVSYSTADRIKELENQGYEVVTDGVPKPIVFDNQKDPSKTDPTQKFEVTLRHKVTTITPNTPEGEVPTPGQPINPSNPDGPKWPEEVSKVKLSVTRTIRYRYANDPDNDLNKVFEDVVQTVTYTRTVTVDHVTGDVTTTPWAPIGEETVPAVDSPEKAGYTRDKATVAAATPTTSGSGNDFTATLTDEKVLYTPEVLEKGSVKFVEVGTPEPKYQYNLTGKTGEAFKYDPEEKINEFKKAGYTVTNKDNYSPTGTFDNVPDNSQDFVYELTPRIEPVTPGDKPVPGKPVDPNDPNSPVWPKSVENLELTKTITRTITYVDNAG
ncbi:YSIRK-type signal peptide-containing protein, partial [Streptococcus sp. ZJ93]|uniref:mucin-binding protein n=1 Tax=Streptococcus handemini TaxID=3161188 RepID=UPI0034D60F21